MSPFPSKGERAEVEELAGNGALEKLITLCEDRIGSGLKISKGDAEDLADLLALRALQGEDSSEKKAAVSHFEKKVERGHEIVLATRRRLDARESRDPTTRRNGVKREPGGGSFEPSFDPPGS